MAGEFTIKGTFLEEAGKPFKNLSVKAYNEKGELITSSSTDKDGKVSFVCNVAPASVKMVYNGKTLAIKDLRDFVGPMVDLKDFILCLIPSANWHIKGTVKDKMSGGPISGVTVEVFDEDQGPPVTRDYLGEDITNATGKFDIWFNTEDFAGNYPSGSPESYPDIFLRVKNNIGVVIHETEIDMNVTGMPHKCIYCSHRGKSYTLEIDYVTDVINKVGPVSTSDIDASGFATQYASVNDRPFGGNVTISGRIWGAKVDKWRLSYSAGFVDSADPRFSGLGPSSSDPFSTIDSGASKVWDGPIKTWNTSGLNGTYTIILVVWDTDGNEYHDTQIVFLHNTAISPPAQITTPVSGSTISKANGTNVQIQGTASDDYFYYYYLYWAGCSQTELTNIGITYPPAGNQTPVVAGNLGTWDISGLSNGPYVLRHEVHDRTIVNDGASVISDWTWHTVTITD